MMCGSTYWFCSCPRFFFFICFFVAKTARRLLLGSRRNFHTMFPSCVSRELPLFVTLTPPSAPWWPFWFFQWPIFSLQYSKICQMHLLQILTQWCYRGPIVNVPFWAWLHKRQGCGGHVCPCTFFPWKIFYHALLPKYLNYQLEIYTACCQCISTAMCHSVF